jgi:hypothetical protein
MNLPVMLSDIHPAFGPRKRTPARGRALAPVRQMTRLAPIVRASVVAAVAGLGVEYVLRSAAMRALTSAGRAAKPRSALAAVEGTRVIVTEFVIRERVRRFR